MKQLDLDKIFTRIYEFTEKRDWDQFHSIKNLTMALNVECAELLEIFQWMPESQSNLVSQDKELKNKVEEEVADIFIYLANIVRKTDIDLEEIVLNKIKKNSLKYPIEKSKGNSKKYTEF